MGGNWVGEVGDGFRAADGARPLVIHQSGFLGGVEGAQPSPGTTA